MRNPRTIKLICIILLVSLIAPILSLGEEVLFTDVRDDGTVSAVLIFLIFSVICYFITIRYCNRLILNNHFSSRYRFVFYLILCIITFICTLFAFGGSIYGFYDSYRENRDNFSNRQVEFYLILFGIFVYSILGPLMFFMQLQLRRLLLTKTRESLEMLIDSIGNENV